VTAAGRQLHDSIRQRALALEESGDLSKAVSAWQLLAEARGDAALRSVANSRIEKLSRRIRDIARAEELLASGKGHLEAAITQAEQNSHFGLVVEVRRLQVAQQRDVRSLTAFGSALRRAGDFDQATAALEEAIQMEPSKPNNLPAYVAKGALLRAIGDKRGARDLLEELHDLDQRDPYVATTLAATYLDYAEQNGQTHLLDPAERLIGIAYAQQHDPLETKALYRRLDSLKRKVGV
jgi:tetratricopeptide (TPR) repeat protein